MQDKLIGIQEAAELLDVSVDTLRLWDNAGKFVAVKTEGRHRRYRLSDIYEYQGRQFEGEENNADVVCVYCRVSSHDQKQKGDLDRQKGRVLEYCLKNKYKVEYILEEVGSGMSDTRCKLNKMFKLVSGKKINRIVVEHKDRLCRFNFGIYRAFFESHGVKVEWLDDVLPQSYEAELVEDMLSLMATFSARIYGKRSAENRKKKAGHNE